MQKPYRKNAAVIITDGQERVLLCKRIGTLPFVQTVQGGVDEGETHREAAIRELSEELGLSPDLFEIVAECPTTMRYEFLEEMLGDHPFLDRFQGQEQTFFLAKVDQSVVFNLLAHEQEFEKVWWGTPEELVAEAWSLKRPGIEMALRAFGFL